MSLAALRGYLAELTRLRGELERYHGVWDIDVGYRFSAGKMTDDLAARLFVIGPKRPPSSRTSYRLAPKSLDGLPLDVISFEFQPHAGRTPAARRLSTRRGIIGGLSIGTPDDAPGTLGAVFRSSKYAGLVGLTSAHLAPDPREHVFAPSPVDAEGGLDLGEVVAIDYDYGASLIAINAPGAAPGAVMGLPNLCGFVYDDELHAMAIERKWVTKSGRTTGVTRARITGLGSSGTITITAGDGLSEIASGGDSGSIWMTDDGRAVGLHFAGGKAGKSGWAQAMPMYKIAENLGLSV